MNAQGVDVSTLPVLCIDCSTHHIGRLALLSRHTPASELPLRVVVCRAASLN